MPKFSVFSHSNREVRRAGETIASDLIWTDETAPTIRHAFDIANSWRESHAHPMKSIRSSVIQHMRQAGLIGITAARLKRMQAIRRKLRRGDANFKLNYLQDLGGCRVIMEDMQAVSKLVDVLRDKARHTLRGEDNYISEPKADGYRSHHIKFSYKAKDVDTKVFDGRRIELQVRTRLQHSWATAVEAVGLFRGEDLKGQGGSEAWLRLFALVSAEFADTEACPTPALASNKLDRLQELKNLEAELEAVAVLERIQHGVRGTDFPLSPGYRPTHYLIRYVHATKTVFVVPHNVPRDAARSYERAEAFGNRADSHTETVVLVEVDKIENLKAAYPNYFGDVAFFRSQLQRIVRGEPAIEYAAATRQLASRPLAKFGDLSWLRQSRFPKPFMSGKKGT